MGFSLAIAGVVLGGWPALPVAVLNGFAAGPVPVAVCAKLEGATGAITAMKIKKFKRIASPHVELNED